MTSAPSEMNGCGQGGSSSIPSLLLGEADGAGMSSPPRSTAPLRNGGNGGPERDEAGARGSEGHSAGRATRHRPQAADPTCCCEAQLFTSRSKETPSPTASTPPSTAASMEDVTKARHVGKGPRTCLGPGRPSECSRDSAGTKLRGGKGSQHQTQDWVSRASPGSGSSSSWTCRPALSPGTGHRAPTLAVAPLSASRPCLSNGRPTRRHRCRQCDQTLIEPRFSPVAPRTFRVRSLWWGLSWALQDI